MLNRQFTRNHRPPPCKGRIMIGIHCYICGGFIGDPSQIVHRPPANMALKTFGAVTTSARCTCTPPVVYGPPPGRPSSVSLSLQ